MKAMHAVLGLTLLLGGCVTESDEPETTEDDSEGDTEAPAASQYGSCASNDDCEDPTPFCFAQLGVCMKACAAVETCPEAPPESGAVPVCGLSEFDGQPYQVCLLSCSSADQCPADQACAAVPECQDCGGPVCQPG